MENENKEEKTSENQEENETLKNEEELETPETPQEEKPEGEKPEKSKELQSALAQKDHWRKKAEDAEKQLQLKKEKPPESASKETKDEWRSKVDFLLKNSEKKYSEEEFDHIANIASHADVSLDEAAKREDEYIQFKREKVEADKKTPSPSTKSSISEKPIEDVKPKDLSDMTNEEKDKYWIKTGWLKPPKNSEKEK